MRSASGRSSEVKPQLGTLGSGNHFLEVQYVDEVFDETTAARLNLAEERSYCC